MNKEERSNCHDRIVKLAHEQLRIVMEYLAKKIDAEETAKELNELNRQLACEYMRLKEDRNSQ